MEKLRESSNKLQEANNKLKAKGKDLRGTMHTMKEEYKAKARLLEEENAGLRLAMAEFMSSRPHHDCYLLMAKNKELEKELEDAKEYKEKAKSLLDIGIAIRLRFLAQEGDPSLDDGPESAGRIAIKKGNEAAHYRNETADSALSAIGILTETVHWREALRGHTTRPRPAIWVTVGCRRRKMDCNAILRAPKVVQGGG
jgi:hypothetical protein